MDETRTTVMRLLEELQGGNAAAADELFSLLYGELRGLAHRQRKRWSGDHTLNTTALVHEAYLKLVEPARAGLQSRAHFLALASRAMRQILCNHARDRRAQKRGGDVEVLPLDELRAPGDEVGLSPQQAELLADLDEALRRLEQLDPRQGKVVECRFFGGLTIEETAAALGISPRTVKRDWAVAQAWLQRELAASP